MKAARIAPSLLAAHFANLGEEIRRIEADIDMLHLDVMDGHFVPNLSFGMPVIASLRAATPVYFDCHLMTTNPDAYLEEFKEAGADLVTVHLEVVPNPVKVAARAREIGLDFGLVLNPPTPFSGVEPFVELADLLLIMSVYPGFGGQSFMPEVLPKIEAAAAWREEAGLSFHIEVDGGIDAKTASRCGQAGANVLVAGSSTFKAPDMAAAIRDIRSA